MVPEGVVERSSALFVYFVEVHRLSLGHGNDDTVEMTYLYLKLTSVSNKTYVIVSTVELLLLLITRIDQVLQSWIIAQALKSYYDNTTTMSSDQTKHYYARISYSLYMVAKL